MTAFGPVDRPLSHRINASCFGFRQSSGYLTDGRCLDFSAVRDQSIRSLSRTDVCPSAAIVARIPSLQAIRFLTSAVLARVKAMRGRPSPPAIRTAIVSCLNVCRGFVAQRLPVRPGGAWTKRKDRRCSISCAPIRSFDHPWNCPSEIIWLCSPRILCFPICPTDGENNSGLHSPISQGQVQRMIESGSVRMKLNTCRSLRLVPCPSCRTGQPSWAHNPAKHFPASPIAVLMAVANTATQPLPRQAADVRKRLALEAWDKWALSQMIALRGLWRGRNPIWSPTA